MKLQLKEIKESLVTETRELGLDEKLGEMEKWKGEEGDRFGAFIP